MQSIRKANPDPAPKCGVLFPAMPAPDVQRWIRESVDFIARVLPEAKMNADSARATNTFKFAEEFPDRIFCFGISEADMLSTAAGMSTTGLKTVEIGFSMFVTEKPFEQIRQSIAYPNLNVKIIATHAGLCVGKDGASHQAFEDIAVIRTLPNFRILVAADVQETQSAIVLIHTGADKRWREADWQPYAYLAHDAAKWLFERRRISVIGTDGANLEDHSLPDQPNHNALLGSGVAIIESMRNLDKIENGRAFVFILPLPIKGVDSSPVRIIAINEGGLSL